jgi:chemotaxis methyl-accepting protein methylase
VAGEPTGCVRWARFGRHNLIHDPFPPPGETRFDLILCRNVLIYFEPALARHVTELLGNSLRPGGTVMLGAADVLQVSPARRHESLLQQVDLADIAAACRARLG